MTQSTKKEFARGTILMNSSQNQLHVEHSPVDSHPGSYNVSPNMRMHMSTEKLRQHKSVDKKVNKDLE